MGNKKGDVIIRLLWYNEIEGGLKSIPDGDIFAANMRFEGDDNLWSVVILKGKSELNEPRRQIVDVGILFREKTEGYLKPGKRIYIYEGPQKRIAEGEILSVND
jgi:hypothetical protein